MKTILLVDDNELVVDIAKNILELLGYNVLTTGTGKESIEIYGSNNHKIDVVILDMKMEGMNGCETCEKLKQINPALKVIFASGYGVEDLDTDVLELECDGFIQKPFTVQKLNKTLKTIII